MKYLAIILTLAALVAGCAEQPPADAVIEDRGVKASPKIEEAPPAETQGMATVPMETKPIAETMPAAPPPVEAEATPVEEAVPTPPPVAKPEQQVETHALAEAATEVKPLAGAQGGSGEKAAEAASAGEEQQAPIPLKLKDPNSPLSKRVLLFDFDSAAIRDEYRNLLEAHAEFLKENPGSKIILQGNTDERGSREYNLALGQRRAESVFKALSLLGVPELQMEAVSLGEEKPVAEGHDEAAWQQNRRTVIIYQGE